MTQISAYLNFSGNCREAMTFYQECLGGELKLQTVEESPVANQMPPEARKSILHSTLALGNSVLMGSDMAGPDGVIRGNAISLTLQCSSEQEILRFFSKLSAGGKITHPLQEEFWGATFGQLTDKFGINWLLNYQKRPLV